MKPADASLKAVLELLQTWYLPRRLALRRLATPTLLCEDSKEAEACQCSERFLQILWNEQRLAPALRLSDGRALEVITPGTWNVAGGPDFLNAVLRLDGAVCRGAVEVHREEADWYRHGHDRDPAYASTILHVVWRRPGPTEPAPLPCLELASHLDQPLRALLEELQATVYPYARQVAPGVCAMRWALTDDGSVCRLLRAAALARFEDKSLRLQRHAVAVGAPQALYEAVFEALGYKANRVPFRTLAQQVPLAHLRRLEDAAAREAALFGAAGLLPDPSTAAVLPEWRARVRDLWDRWWEAGGTPLGLAWNRGGSRPLNSPHRRLAAGLAWLDACHLDPETWLQQLAASHPEPSALVRALRRQAQPPSPWEPVKDCTVRLRRPARLLGQARRDDLVANVLLPALHAHAVAHGDPSLADLARKAFLHLPRLQDNRVLQEAAHRFLVPPSRQHDVLHGAADQQGLMELYRCFCVTLGGDCQRCPLIAAPPEASPDPDTASGPTNGAPI